MSVESCRKLKPQLLPRLGKVRTFKTFPAQYWLWVLFLVLPTKFLFKIKFQHQHNLFSSFDLHKNSRAPYMINVLEFFFNTFSPRWSSGSTFQINWFIGWIQVEFYLLLLDLRCFDRCLWEMDGQPAVAVWIRLQTARSLTRGFFDYLLCYLVETFWKEAKQNTHKTVSNTGIPVSSII